MEFFSKDELLAAAASPERLCEAVDLTLRGVTKSVWVQGMSGKERDEWERSNLTKRKGRVEADFDKIGNARARLAARCIVDKPNGSRLFTDGDAVLLGNLPATVLGPIYEKAQRLSGVTDEDLDELKKFSESGAGSASSSS